MRDTASLRKVEREVPRVGGVHEVYPRAWACAKVVAVGLFGDVTSKTAGGARVSRW